MVSRDELGFGLRDVERSAVCFGERGDVVGDEGDEEKRVLQDMPVPDPTRLGIGDFAHVQGTDGDDDGEERQAHRNLVADDLRDGTHRAVQGPLVVGGVTAHDEAEDADGGSGQEKEDAAVDGGGREERAEGDDGERGHRRGEDHVGSEAEEELIGLARDDVFLREELDGVADQGAEPVPALRKDRPSADLDLDLRSDFHGPEPALDDGGKLSLRVDRDRGVAGDDADHDSRHGERIDDDGESGADVRVQEGVDERFEIDRVHRSISPRTISMEPSVAMMSEMSISRVYSSKPERLQNEGDFALTRKGCIRPSAMT